MRQLFTLFIALLGTLTVFAGNPDRQGEAGAHQLLMNPWARSAGLHTMNTSTITGVEAMRLNVAGLSRISSTEINLGHAIYFDGVDISMNAIGLAQRIGKNGAIGFSIMAIDFGDIRETTALLPEGTGATFSPRFFNLGLSYSHMFENKVSVGVTVRAVSESISDATGTAMAIDAGVQYVTGERDRFKFGISLRNVGSRMTYRGEGLSTTTQVEEGGGTYPVTVNQRSDDLELQSLLSIGISYDFISDDMNVLTLLGNFTSNAFSRDNAGVGLEYTFNEMFSIRGAYRYTIDQGDEVVGDEIYTGLAGGFSVDVPFSKLNPNAGSFGIDYGYRTTQIYGGTHNIGLRVNL